MRAHGPQLCWMSLVSPASKCQAEQMAIWRTRADNATAPDAVPALAFRQRKEALRIYFAGSSRRTRKPRLVSISSTLRRRRAALRVFAAASNQEPPLVTTQGLSGSGS